MTIWKTIPNEELVENAVSSHEHFRIIRDNTTIIEKIVYGQVAPKVEYKKHWRLIATTPIRTKVGEECRYSGPFGGCYGRRDVHRITSYYTWQAEFNAIGTETLLVTPPRPDAILIGVEAIGDGIGFEDRTNWRLGDFDLSISSQDGTQNINVFYNAYALGGTEYPGSTFRDNPNAPPNDPSHYPNGSMAVPNDENPTETLPAYHIRFNTIWASAGDLTPPQNTKAPVGNIPF